MPAPSPAKRIINQSNIELNIFLEEIVREMRARIPIRMNAYL
jgi:hypothetical protein